jgi:hypothetical protein
VDWVYLLPVVGQWRFRWTGFICLNWTGEDSCGPGLSASSGPAETLWTGFICFLYGPVEIPVDRVYLPRVDQRTLFGLSLSASCSGPVEIPLDCGFLLQMDQRRFQWTGFIYLKGAVQNKGTDSIRGKKNS